MSDSVLATKAPMFNGGPIPGPFVYAINLMSFIVMFASERAWVIRGRILS